MIRPYRGGLVLPTWGKGLLSECPATGLNRKSTGTSTAGHSLNKPLPKVGSTRPPRYGRIMMICSLPRLTNLAIAALWVLASAMARGR
jgi:hypothetical protein